MRPGNYEQALLEVERSELPVLDLLPNVAEIINLDLNELQEAWAQCDCKAVVPKPVIEFFRKTRIAQEPETTFMPKEEWALRWLLKRLPGPSKEEEQETGELLGSVHPLPPLPLFDSLTSTQHIGRCKSVYYIALSCPNTTRQIRESYHQ